MHLQPCILENFSLWLFSLSSIISDSILLTPWAVSLFSCFAVFFLALHKPSLHERRSQIRTLLCVTLREPEVHTCMSDVLYGHRMLSSLKTHRPAVWFWSHIFIKTVGGLASILWTYIFPSRKQFSGLSFLVQHFNMWISQNLPSNAFKSCSNHSGAVLCLMLNVPNWLITFW